MVISLLSQLGGIRWVEAIRVLGFLYAFLAILSMPALVYWSFAIPSALRGPSAEASL